LQDVYQPRGQFKNAKVAYCIHNIAFQGRFWPESFKDMQLPQSTMSKLGFIDGYSKVRYLSADNIPVLIIYQQLSMVLCCSSSCTEAVHHAQAGLN
jgi:glycogen synthase